MASSAVIGIVTERGRGKPLDARLGCEVKVRGSHGSPSSRMGMLPVLRIADCVDGHDGGFRAGSGDGKNMLNRVKCG